MPTRHFNSQTAKTIKPAARSIEYFTKNFACGYPGSLGMRVSPKGKKSWIIRYRTEGDLAAKRFNIGYYPPMTFGEASKKATTLLQGISEGIDPRNEKTKRLSAPTFENLWDTYYKYHAKRHKRRRSIDGDRWLWKKYLQPAFGLKKAKDIERKEVTRFFDELTERGPTLANRAVALISTIYNVGIDRDIVGHNPATRIRKNKEIPRDRVLTEDEIRNLWKAWGNSTVGYLFKLKLLTGQRDSEIKTMRWEDIDSDGNWIIPASVAKNKREHLVPLSRQAFDILDRIPKKSTYVFHSLRSKSGHREASNNLFRQARDTAGVDSDIRGHDLRRTVASLMAKAKTPNSIISRILNHVTGNPVTAIYNRYNYFDEKRIALQKWADMVDRILGKTEARVVEFRGKRAGYNGET